MAIAPLISVVIPVCNGAQSIRQTIISVLEQTFSDFELIVIDDGSTDNTSEIIRQIQDPRLRIFSYPNAGVSASRNRGFKCSSGAYVSFIDADDIWVPDKLEKQYQALQDNPEAAVAYSWTNCIDQQGNFLRKCSYVGWTGSVLPQLLLDDFIGTGSNVMIRRNAFESTGGFDETLGGAEDTDFWLRLAARYPFVVVPKPQVLYRIAPQSASSNLRKMEQCNLRVINRAFQEAPDSLQYLKPHAIANLYKNLSYKALDTQPGRQQSLTALRYLLTVIRTDPAMVMASVMPKAFLKLAIMSWLPVTWAESLLRRFPKIANTSTFLGYEKTDLSKI